MTRRLAILLVALALLIPSSGTQAGPVADAFAVLEAQVAAQADAIATLNDRVAALEAEAADPEPTANVVNVSSIAALKAAIADDSVDEIVVANGTYVVASASLKAPTSLWITGGRTRPVLVRAETRHGVLLSGNGATSWIGLSFSEGAHDQTWDGFDFGHGQPTNTGVVSFGGTYGGPVPVAPHHITIRHTTLRDTLTAHNDLNDHGFYVNAAQSPGPNHLTFEDILVEANLSSAFHLYDGLTTASNGSDVTIRRLTVTGATWQALIFWDTTLARIRVEDSTVSGARKNAVAYGKVAAGGVTLERVTSTGSAQGGLYAPSQTGLTLIETSLQ